YRFLQDVSVGFGGFAVSGNPTASNRFKRFVHFYPRGFIWGRTNGLPRYHSMLVSARVHFEGAPMPLFRCGFCLLALSCLSGVCMAQEPHFPTADEINLLLTQTERAVGQYKPLLDQEKSLFGEKGIEAVAKDWEVVHGLETAIKGFRKNPQAFNSKLG